MRENQGCTGLSRKVDRRTAFNISGSMQEAVTCKQLETNSQLDFTQQQLMSYGMHNKSIIKAFSGECTVVFYRIYYTLIAITKGILNVFQENVLFYNSNF